jgi:hypothetical protein
VLGLHADGVSYRLIARNVGLSKNTVMEIVRRGAALVSQNVVYLHRHDPRPRWLGLSGDRDGI